jgi:hypothetical protein
MRTQPRALLVSCVALAANIASPPSIRAQIPAISTQIEHASGQSVTPVFEGWFHAADGTVRASFGFVNPNTKEIVNVPVGPENKVEPGTADQGQPTRFAPGRQYGVFTVAVPRDRSKTEVTWTLTVHGKTTSIPANLKPEFVIEPFKEVGGSFPGNTPPVVKLDAGGESIQGPVGVTVTRSATVGIPMPLDVWATDDGLPPPTERRGVSVTWSLFRGPREVTFENPTPRLDQGKAFTTVTFAEPGEYVLRAVATDGSAFSAQCCWTNGYVRVTAAPARAGRP